MTLLHFPKPHCKPVNLFTQKTKSFLYFFIKSVTTIFIFILCSSVNSQEYDYSGAVNDNETIFKGLSILKSGTTNNQKINYDTFFHLKRNESIVEGKKQLNYIISGKKIKASSILKHEMLSSFFQKKGTKQTYLKNKPSINNFTIICDELEIDTHFHLPGTNINFEAQNFIFGDYDIVSSPLPLPNAIFENAKNLKAEDISKDDIIINRYNGKNKRQMKSGLNGGNITINAQDINLIGKNKGLIITNGGDGEYAVIPKFSVNYGALKNIDSYREIYWANNGSNRSKKTKFNNIIALNTQTKEILCTLCGGKTNKKTVYYPKEISYNWNTKTLKDEKEFSRIIKNEESVVYPGNGGTGGIIEINILNKKKEVENQLQKRANFIGGKPGGLTTREDKGITSYFDKTTLKLNSTKVTYNLYSAKTEYEKNTFSPNLLISLKEDIEKSIKIPTDAAINKATENLKKIASEEGKKGTFNFGETKSITNSIYYNNIFNQLEKQFQKYYTLKSDEKTKINNELLSLNKRLNEDLKKKNIDALTFKKLKNLKIKINNLQTRKHSIIDEMGNLPGYRPVLNLASLYQFLNKNIEDDIDILINANNLLSLELDKEEILNNVETSIEYLEQENEKTFNKYKNLTSIQDSINLKAIQIITLTDSIKNNIKIKEAELNNEAKKEEDAAKNKAFLLEMGALAASVIPYGQPILKDVVGNGLQAYAESIKLHKDGECNAIDIMNKVDLTSSLDKIKDFRNFKYADYVHEDKAEKLASELDIHIPVLGLGELDNFKLKYKNAAIKSIKDGKEKHNKKRQKALDEYNKDSEKYVKMANGATLLAKKSLNHIAGKEISTEDIDYYLQKLLKADKEYQDLVRQIKKQTVLKESLFNEINILSNLSNSYQAKIFKNEMIIANLMKVQLDDNYFNPNTKNTFKSILNNIIDKFIWIEYSLTKAYEYNTVETLPLEGISLSDFINKQLKDINLNSIPKSKAKENIKTAFKGRLSEIAKKIVKNATKNNKQTDIEFTLNQTFYPKIIKSLNSTKSIIIDFYEDFGDLIVSPSREKNKIRNIDIEYIKLKNTLPKNTSIEINIDFEEAGIMRKNDKFYTFYTPEKNGKSVENYTWTIQSSTNNPKIKKNEISEEYRDLLKLLISEPSQKNDINNFFASPPAISKAEMTLEKNGNFPNDYKLIIEEIKLKVTLDFEKSQKTKKVLDLRQDKNELIPIEIKIGNDNKISTSNSYYQILKKDTQVTLRIPKIYLEKFIKWECSDFNTVNKIDLTKSEIIFPLKNNIFIKPKFKN